MTDAQLDAAIDAMKPDIRAAIRAIGSGGKGG